MKTSHLVKSLFIALALLSAPNVFAANMGSLHVSSPEDVAGQPLDAGDYIVQWEDSGPNVELRIMQGKHVVATAIANVMPLPNASISDSVVLPNHCGKTESVANLLLRQNCRTRNPGAGGGHKCQQQVNSLSFHEQVENDREFSTTSRVLFLGEKTMRSRMMILAPLTFLCATGAFAADTDSCQHSL